MTNEQLIKKAGKAWTNAGSKGGDMGGYLNILIELARADEREKCIKVVMRVMGDWQLGKDVIATLRGGK